MALPLALIGAGVGAASGLLGQLGNIPNFNLGEEGTQESRARRAAEQGLAGMAGIAGAPDFSRSAQGFGDLASLYGQLGRTGNQPTGRDVSQARSYASSIFGQQRVGLQQSFLQQLQQANEQAALSGRSINDPILKARLGQEQMRQTALLDAGQAGFAAQYAQQLPGQRLGFAEGRVNALTAQEDRLNMAQQQAFGNFGNLAQLGFGMQSGLMGNRLDIASAQFQSDKGKKNFADILSGGLRGGMVGFGAFSQAGGGSGSGDTGVFSGSGQWNESPYAGMFTPQAPSFGRVPSYGSQPPPFTGVPSYGRFGY